MAESGGLWVRFRVEIVPRPTPSGALYWPPLEAVRVSGISRGQGTEGGEGRLIYDTFIVRIELGMPPAPERGREIVRRVSEGLYFNVLSTALALEFAVEEKLRANPSPSPPGEPPGQDTGALLSSVRTKMDEDGLGAAVGTDLDYARHVEFGTLAALARPFLLNTFEDHKTLIEREIGRAARELFDIATGQPITFDRLGYPKLTGDPKLDAVILWKLYYSPKEKERPPPIVDKPEPTTWEKVKRFWDENEDDILQTVKDILETIAFKRKLKWPPRPRGPRSK